MFRFFKIMLLLGLLGGPLRPVVALELFGVNLTSTNSSELRNAVKEAGVLLIREGGESNWFDVYDSSKALAGSTRLYLGFVKQDQSFAFAEYEFNSLNPGQLLSRLTAKYGTAEIREGRFISDRKYRWQRDGIEIELSSDWQSHKTRLSYVNPPRMSALLAERASYQSRLATDAPSFSIY
jgi:hypothetical protein